MPKSEVTHNSVHALSTNISGGGKKRVPTLPSSFYFLPTPAQCHILLNYIIMIISRLSAEIGWTDAWLSSHRSWYTVQWYHLPLWLELGIHLSKQSTKRRILNILNCTDSFSLMWTWQFHGCELYTRRTRSKRGLPTYTLRKLWSKQLPVQGASSKH